MVHLLLDIFHQAERDSATKLIILKGSGDRAFCAGGDIRVLAEASQKGNYELSHKFFRAEYRLDHFIHELKKPCIAFIDGITMGGGVGLSIGCKYRIATELTTFAMPETAIGFFPDVGGSSFLSRLPNGIGVYLALLGVRLSAADLLFCKIATHFVCKANWVHVEEALCRTDLTPSAEDAVESVLARFASLPPEGQCHIKDHQSDINRYFDVAAAEQVFSGLLDENDKNPWAESARKSLLTKSPTSVKVTFKALQHGRHMPIKEVFAMELRVATRFMKSHDFVEGVTAVIIKKHQRPRWQPASQEEVSLEIVNSFFVPFEDASWELWAEE